MCFKFIKWCMFKMFKKIGWTVDNHFSESLWTHSGMEFMHSATRMCKNFYCSYLDLHALCALTISPSFPATFQALFVKSGALWLGLTFAFRTTHLPASQVEEKAVPAYMVLLEVVVVLLLSPGSQLQCWIVNMPVLEMKSEKMSAYSILVQERTSELHSPLLLGE